MKKVFLYVMAIGYFLAGLNHFVNPDFYEPIMPAYLSHHLILNYLSGVAEIICALLLIPIRTRRIGAWLTIVVLIAVYPANIQMAINWWHRDNPDLWIALARLPLQFLLVWWAYMYTKAEAKPLAQESV